MTVTDSLGRGARRRRLQRRRRRHPTGTVSYASPVLTWTGGLAAGATATVTFSVTVEQPRHRGQGADRQRRLARRRVGLPGPAPPSAPCRSTLGVLTPALDIAATTGAATAVPGGTVHYTITNHQHRPDP